MKFCWDTRPCRLIVTDDSDERAQSFSGQFNTSFTTLNMQAGSHNQAFFNPHNQHCKELKPRSITSL